MNIIHISDTHTHHNRIPLTPCDLIICTGDFCKINFNLSQSEGNKLTYSQSLDFLKWLKSYLATYKVIISGNHESFLNSPTLYSSFESLCKEKGIVFKDSLSPFEIIDINGLKIAGTGSYPFINNIMPTKHAYFFKEDYYKPKNTDNSIQDKIDIFLSHVPPLVSSGSGREYECPELRQWLLNRIKVNNHVGLVLCGHVHECKGEFSIESTRVYNSALNFNPVLIKV